MNLKYIVIYIKSVYQPENKVALLILFFTLHIFSKCVYVFLCLISKSVKS